LRITILTLGSRGDVQPYLALAVGLQRAGYSVRVASHAIFEFLIRGYGVDFALVRFNPRDVVNNPEVQKAKSNIFRFMRTVRRLVGPQYLQIFDDFWYASQDADAIIASPTASNAYDCAQELQVPLILGLLQPLIPTRVFPSFFLPPFPRFSGIFNRATHHLFDQLLWQNVRSSVNQWRKVRLGLRSAAFFGPYRRQRAARVPCLIACSPSVIPKPPDWQEWHYVTGYWFLEPHSDFRPPPHVESFLQSGPPPVYVGFGSMAQEQPEWLAGVVADALEQSNQRGILASGWGWSQPAMLPDTILQVDQVSHQWLFPRMAALVHHGGAGTAATALQSGVPSIVVPFGGDQHHWGRILVTAGVSPCVLPIDDLTTEALAHAITLATNDHVLRTRASTLGESIRKEDGVSRAVEIVDQHLG
jgi:UDP:flavonoid glycosyltransferase YjiC (YdhE family)